MDIVKEETFKLVEKKARAMQMGGAEAVEKQHESGKLTARERIELLMDKDSFVEFGILATHSDRRADMKGKVTPCDGVITGTGKIHGKQVAVAVYDFTVMGGSMGEVGERKVLRMRELALKERMPMIWLLDSAGARIQEAAGAQFAGTGNLFYEQVEMSGVVPQIAAIMGPTAAGTAYIPALADFVPMVKGTSSMALAGPHLVKTAINEDVTVEDLGGSRIHNTKSGCADMELEDDKHCIEVIRQYLSYFPENNEKKPPRIHPHRSEDFYKVSDEILEILPENSRKPYNIKPIIEHIVDRRLDEKGKDLGPDFLELKPDFAKNIVTGLGRIDGRSVGFLANQPKFMGGALDCDAADKSARFLWLCNAFNIPVVFLHDCPGFMVGSRMEHMGIIRHGAKMLYAVSELTVPKFSVVIRRSYGAGYYVMCGKGLQPDLIVGWPTSEIGLMSPEGAVNIAFRKEIKNAPDPEAAKAKKVEQYRSFIGGQTSAAGAYIDDIIDPRQTRKILANALEYTENKKRQRPFKHNGVYPV